MIIDIYKDRVTKKEKVIIKTPCRNEMLTKKQFVTRVTEALNKINYEVTYKGESTKGEITKGENNERTL